MQNCENFADTCKSCLVNKTYELIPRGISPLQRLNVFTWWALNGVVYGNGQKMCKNLELITGQRVPE